MRRFRYAREVGIGVASALALAAYKVLSTPRIHPEQTVSVRKVVPPSREMEPLARPLLSAPPRPPPIVAPGAPRERAPYENPAFGSDVARSLDTRHTLDEFHQLPLEGLGRTVLNSGAHEEVLNAEVAETVKPRPDRRVKMLRLRILRLRDANATTVHIGSIRFFWGMSRIVDPGLVLWDPHSGERKPYHGEAWVDGDQRTAVFIFTEPVEVTRYQFQTSTEDPGLDPFEWVLEGSRNGTFWTELDVHGPAGSPPPRVRGTWINYPIRATA